VLAFPNSPSPLRLLKCRVRLALLTARDSSHDQVHIAVYSLWVVRWLVFHFHSLYTPSHLPCIRSARIRCSTSHSCSLTSPPNSAHLSPLPLLILPSDLYLL